VGAAIQAGVLSGEVKDVLLLERHAALARHRNAGRRDDEAHREKHDDSDQGAAGLLDRG